MSKRFKIGLNIALALIVAAGAAVLLIQQLRWRDSAAANRRAGETAHFTLPWKPSSRPADPSGLDANPEDPLAEELAQLDMEALRAVNPDVAGWIYIPGTEISYPVLQGKDNDYYLKHTWEKDWNGGGSIFMDCRCSRSFSDSHTIIYGHRMNNDTMFAPLGGYADLEFWRERSLVYVADGTCVRRYQIFAAWEPSVSSIVYTLDTGTQEKRQELVELCVQSSQIDTGVVPGPEDQLLTLSTCVDLGRHTTRWVVQAKLVQVYQPPAGDPAE